MTLTKVQTVRQKLRALLSLSPRGFFKRWVAAGSPALRLPYVLDLASSDAERLGLACMLNVEWTADDFRRAVIEARKGFEGEK